MASFAAQYPPELWENSLLKPECRRARRDEMNGNDTIYLKYLAEGAANLVFSIVPWSTENGQTPLVFVDNTDTVLPRSMFMKKVLRISKGVPKTLNCKAIMDGFTKMIEPLFVTPNNSPLATEEPTLQNRDFVSLFGGGTNAEHAIKFEAGHTVATDRSTSTRCSTRPEESTEQVSVAESKHPSELKPLRDYDSTPATPPEPCHRSDTPTEHVDTNVVTAATSRTWLGMKQYLMEHEAVFLWEEVMQVLTAEFRPTKTSTDDQWGILLPNMSSIPQHSCTIEFKPKWLQQSPNAPENASRCRNCAMHAMRRVEKKRETTGPYICPLWLTKGVNGDIREWVVKKVSHVDQSFPKHTLEQIVDRITEYLSNDEGREILNHLKTHQWLHDKTGVLGIGEFETEDKMIKSEDLQAAMTLRDCSMYIKVTYADKDFPIECKLGDLDYKSEEKLDDWMAKELELIDGRWYVRELTDDHLEGCFISAREQSRKGAPFHWEEDQPLNLLET